MNARAARACIALIAILLLTANALADVSVFVATDRHAIFETVSEAPPGPEADAPRDAGPGDDGPRDDGQERQKRPPKRKQPLYDADGNLIWHNHLTEVLALVAADGVMPEVVLLGGDNVGDGGDRSIDATGYPIGAPYFSVTAMDAQVRHVFGEGPRCLYTYGSHDIHATDSYEERFFSGPFSGSGYYIYGITFAQMIYDTQSQADAAHYAGKDAADPNGSCAQTASHRFLTWVNSLADQRPIIVMSHVPLHANRGDNVGAWTWTQALNAASERHDIIFLWGHNHTVEQRDSARTVERANYLKLPGDALTVQSWDANGDGQAVRKRDDARVSRTETLRFIYMNAGYITNGVGTVLTFSDKNDDGEWTRLAVKRYALEGGESEPWAYVLRQ